MSSSIARRRRYEALPFEWDQLKEPQQQAMDTVAGLLLDALDELDKRRNEKVQPLDQNRRSQIAFIDGDRGMGKTSVLLSLHRLTGDGSAAPNLFPNVAKLHAQRERLVWLPTLDMEPLSHRTNLLAAILARFDDHLRVFGRVSSPAMALAFDDRDKREETLSALNQLQSNAVVAWDGVDPARAGHIDPSAYAAEVIQSEHAGLDLNGQLGRVLEGLADAFKASNRAANPLFIIPVDDFDLAASRCLELLRIVRMVTTPRLFFLIAGNTRIAEDVLRFQTEGELAKLVGHGIARTEADRIRMRSLEIAANNLRKLIPPQQRAQLRALTIDEALRLRPASNSATLHDALTGIELVRNNAPMGAKAISLYEFLRPSDLGSKAYLGARWLGSTPRQVLDRTDALLRFKGTIQRGDKEGEPLGWGEAFLRYLAEEMQREVREDVYLSIEQRERIEELLDTTHSVSFEFRSVLRLQTRMWFEKRLDFDYGSVAVNFLESPRWKILSAGARDEEGRPLVEDVPPRLAAGLTLLHDVAISIWGGTVPGAIVYSAPQSFDLIQVNWSVSGLERAPVHWHLPEWWTIREIERFAAHWYRHAETCSSIEDHAAGFLASVLEVVMDEENQPNSTGRAAARIAQMLNALAKEQPTREARRYLRRSALVVCLLLLAPESAAGAEFAARVLVRPKSLESAIDDEVIRRLVLWRAGTFALAAGAAQRREIGPDRAAAALMSAVSPTAAIQVTSGMVRAAINRFKPDYGGTAIEELRKWLDKHQNRQPVTREPPPLTAGQLPLLRSAIKGAENVDLTENVDWLIRPLNAAIVALELERQNKNHPIYKLDHARLVPSLSEISSQNFPQLLNRGNP